MCNFVLTDCQIYHCISLSIMNTNIWNKTSAISAIVAIIVTIIIAWYNKDKNTLLNIEQVNTTLLSQKPDIDGLSVKYVYHDTINVNNLWKAIYTIKNTGDQTLYGSGFSDTNIRNGVIPISLSKCDKLLSVRIISCDNDVFINKNHELVVGQWKPNEYVEVEILAESKSAPEIKINPRVIKDADITYSKYVPTANQTKEKFIDLLPSWLANILKWCTVATIITFAIALLSQIPSHLKSGEKIVVVIFLTLTLFILCAILWIF